MKDEGKPTSLATIIIAAERVSRPAGKISTIPTHTNKYGMGMEP